MKAVVEVLVEQLDQAAFDEQVTFRVDAEFEQVAPPLADDEIDALERQVTQHGILAPLVVWQGVLVDGHNRFRLARRHRLRFDVREVLLLDRASVVAWICDQALARRSLTPLAAAYLRGKRYETAKRDSASTRFEPDARRGQSDHAAGFTRTDERLSKEIGVGARTIRRDAEFARDLDLLVVRMGVELRNEILGRKLQMTRRDVHLVVERALVDVGEVRRFADDARLKRRRAPRAVTGEEEAKFFQREIVQWMYDAEQKVCAVELSCGHQEPYKTRGDGKPSKAKTKSCKTCGSGSRTKHERKMALGDWEKLLADAMRDPSRRKLVVECVMLLQGVLSTPPVGERQREIWSKIDRRAGQARIFSHQDYTQARSA
ncbi:MAG TPA: hypothetical protein VN716_18815 [Vicinamibacterales bacterium]|nr:hypothetical protein [Vicinamibacterales bacterium]